MFFLRRGLFSVSSRYQNFPKQQSDVFLGGRSAQEKPLSLQQSESFSHDSCPPEKNCTEQLDFPQRAKIQDRLLASLDRNVRISTHLRNVGFAGQALSLGGLFFSEAALLSIFSFFGSAYFSLYWNIQADICREEISEVSEMKQTTEMNEASQNTQKDRIS